MRMLKLRNVLLVVVIVLISCPSAYAYFDPGNGGYFLTAVAGYFCSMAVFVCSAVTLGFRKFLLPFFKNKTSFLFFLSILTTLSCGIFIYARLHQVHLSARTYDVKAKEQGPVCISDDPAHVYQGYVYDNGNLYDKHCRLVHSWRKPWFWGVIGTIDKNGDLYAGNRYDTNGYWGRFSWDGQIIWTKNYLIHHMITLDGDKIYVLTKEAHQYRGRSVGFDAIITLDKEGRELGRWSTWDDLAELHRFFPLLLLDIPWIPIPQEKKNWDPELWGMDYFHLNSFQIVQPNSRENEAGFFHRGNWLVSFRNLNMIAILDKNTKEVLWSMYADGSNGLLDRQHNPSMQPDGNILVFDNGFHRGWSRVIKIDPMTKKIVWEYSDKDFFSDIKGLAQVLPNGNIFIDESARGRVFEITPDKKIVWEFLRKVIEKGHDKDDMEWMERVDSYAPEYINPLLNRDRSWYKI